MRLSGQWAPARRPNDARRHQRPRPARLFRATPAIRIGQAGAGRGLPVGLESHLDRFRQQAWALVRQERTSIAVLAEALIARRTMTAAEIGALLSTVTAPPSLWVA